MPEPLPTTADPIPAEATVCAMCGYRFDPRLLTCHAACPLGAHCMVVCCPRCGYSTVDPGRSSLARRLVGVFRHQHNAPKQAVEATATGVERAPTRLLDLKAGQEGHVADVGGALDTLTQLSQYGLLPGTPIRLERKHPVPIVKVGQTHLALDRSIAAQIFIDL